MDPNVENPGKNTVFFSVVLGSTYTNLVGLKIRAHTSNFNFHERACFGEDFFSSFSCKIRIGIKTLSSPANTSSLLRLNFTFLGISVKLLAFFFPLIGSHFQVYALNRGSIFVCSSLNKVRV